MIVVLVEVPLPESTRNTHFLNLITRIFSVVRSRKQIALYVGGFRLIIKVRLHNRFLNVLDQIFLRLLAY